MDVYRWLYCILNALAFAINERSRPTYKMLQIDVGSTFGEISDSYISAENKMVSWSWSSMCLWNLFFFFFSCNLGFSPVYIYAKKFFRSSLATLEKEF